MPKRLYNRAASIAADAIKEFKIENDGILHGTDAIQMLERSSDPADPPEGEWVMWMGDGTGTNDDGDITIKVTAGGATKTVLFFDFSAGLIP